MNNYKSLNEYMNGYDDLSEMVNNLLEEAKKRQDEQQKELEISEPIMGLWMPVLVHWRISDFEKCKKGDEHA